MKQESPAFMNIKCLATGPLLPISMKSKRVFSDFLIILLCEEPKKIRKLFLSVFCSNREIFIFFLFY